MTIAMGKTRKEDAPYITIETPGWGTTKVLKAYSADPDKPFARWFCVVVTDMTGPSGDMGDTYIAEITGRIVQRDPEVPDSAIPSHLLYPGTAPAARDAMSYWL